MDKQDDGSKNLGGGPRWRQLLVALVGLGLLGAWFAWTSSWDEADGAATRPTATTMRLCPAGERCYSYADAPTMKERFKAGRYETASGKRMPRWVFRKAKRYVRNHPWVAPDGARPRVVSGRVVSDWDWGWLDWTAKTLNTARCLSLGQSPVTWFGCDGQPEWVDTVRRVKVKCGGAALIIAGATRNPIAVGSGVGVCLWNEILDLKD